MSIKQEKNGDILFAGFEKGIGLSPHFGLGMIKNANISTQQGEVMTSFIRNKESQTNITNGTLTQTSSNTLTVSNTTPANTELKYGQWITTTGSLDNLPAGNYFVASSSSNVISLSTTYNGTAVSSIGTGSVTFTIIQNTADTGGVMTQPVATQTEIYMDSNYATQYRYYILDSEGHLWVKDTGVAFSGASTSWALVDTVTGRNAALGSSKPTSVVATGLGLINGWLFMQIGNCILTKQTCMLGIAPSTGSAGWDVVTRNVNSGPFSDYPHFMFTAQATLYYTDGAFIGSIFPNPANATINSFSYAEYTVNAGTDTFTVSTLFGGVTPYNTMPITFTSTSGNSNIPGGLSSGTIYYVRDASVSTGAITFKVASSSGGSAIDITGTGTGTQYFNTFNPLIYSSGTPANSTYTFTPQALTLTASEVTTSITDSGTSLLIGTRGKSIYQWDRYSPEALTTIPLSENNTHFLLNVNNMTYAFVGNKGNIYITNGSTASVVVSVPDYCAGIAGTPATYVEPFFKWGGVMYLRGKVYFSIQDQTSSKTGNCGGIWSFIPSNTMSGITGNCLRLENRNSYSTYNGMTTVLVPNQNQEAIAPQYYSGWQSTYSGSSYGIDATGTTSDSTAEIETELIQVGSFLEKNTYSGIEYIVATPLQTGESVAISYRQNSTDAWVALSNVQTDSTSATTVQPGLSGFYPASFEQIHWIQLKVTLTALTTSSSSFCRLSGLRLKKK
jgi:hypothetical protein